MKVRWIFMGLLALAGGYAAAAIANQVKLAQEITFEYAGYQVTGISMQRAQVKLRLRIKNPGGLAFKVISQRYDVYVNNIKVADVSENGRIKVPARGQATVEFMVVFDPRNMVSTLWEELVKNMGNAAIRLKGRLSVLTFGFVYARIPVDNTFILKNYQAT